MSLKIPTRTDGASIYSFEVELDGSTFLFVFYWSEREAAWYFDLQTAEAEQILSSRKVVLDTPLLARHRSKRALPAGELFAVDSSDEGKRPGFEDLGTRVVLHYFTAAELGG